MFLNMSKKGWFEGGVFIQPKFMKFLSGIGITYLKLASISELPLVLQCPAEFTHLFFLFGISDGLQKLTNKYIGIPLFICI